jgi:NADPH-dependent 2,4-dienoyl-CoA reductase/sulfur reductase-like enzyme
MPLKSLEDGRRIKKFMESGNVSQAVIIGMGYIALEMCEALRARNVDVSMVKPRPVFLPWMDPKLASVVFDELGRHGVVSHPGRQVGSVEKDGANLTVICSDLTLTGQMVLIAVGVKPRSELAAAADLELGPSDAIAVDQALQTSDESIYAAGDCADAFHVVTGQRTWVPLALRANRAGWAVADALAGKRVALQGVAGTAVFRIFDLQVARTGLSLAEAEKFGFDPAGVSIETRSRAHAHPGNCTIQVHMVGDRTTGRLLGAQLVGREGVAHRVNALAVALHQKMTVEAFSQCDLAYAPPFSPVWDPMLTAANQLLKKL